MALRKYVIMQLDLARVVPAWLRLCAHKRLCCVSNTCDELVGFATWSCIGSFKYQQSYLYSSSDLLWQCWDSLFLLNHAMIWQIHL